jgi:hypothetical protein
MTDDPASTDGGETAASVDAERAGNTPPDPPTDDGLGRMLPDLLDGTESVTTVYMVRAALADGSGRSVGERLVDAIEDQVTVVGSTLDAGLDPSDPELDVLIETDHDHGAVAASLARVGPVDGVVVADVTAAAERELDDVDEEAEAVDAATANDVFQELQEEVGQEGYGQVVDELEDVSFPGGPDPDEEVDLEAETGIELNDDPEPIEVDDGADPQDGDIDLDDDEISAKDLLGEGEREDAEEVKAPDEKAIEDAISGVDLEDGEEADEPPPDADLGADIHEPSEATDDEPADDEQPAAADASGSAGAPPVDGDMDAFAARLVEALESGAIGEQRRTELREALGIESTHSLDVRMEYIQKRVDTLAAYTDAWESFLDAEGSGREFMQSVRKDLDGVAQRLDRIESTLEELEERQDGEVTRLDTRMDNVESKLEGRIDRLEGAVGTLKEKVKALLEWRERIDKVLNG